MKIRSVIPFKHFLMRVGYYLSDPYPIWQEENVSTNWYIDVQKEFTIDSAEQLAGLAQLVNAGNSFEGKIVKLGRDIVLNDIANMVNWENTQHRNRWIPIGTNNNPFKGTFDGRGHVISGVYINQPNINNLGLFGCTEMEKIKNLWVIAFINGNSSIGGFVGLRRLDYGHICNCYSDIILSGHTDIGGLVGTNQGNSKIFYSMAVGVIKHPVKPNLIGKLNTSDKSLCLNCSNGIVDSNSKDAAGIEISLIEKKLFRLLRNRINKLPYRQSKTWSHYWCRIDVKVKDNYIVINNLLRYSDVNIYNKHNQAIIHTENSGNSCYLKIPVPAGIYIVEVNKEIHPYSIKVG